MSQCHDLNGASVIVTGASSGYGVGIARSLKHRGARVWITGRRQEKLEAVARELEVEPICADVTVPEDWDRVVAAVTDATGRVDVLVNNAGAGIRIAPATDLSDSEILRCLNTNLTGAIFGCRRVAALMQKQGSGTIVNISSICDSECWPGFSVYGAAKAGLLSFSQHLYVEMRAHGVRVTCLTPSWGATEFGQAAGTGSHPAEVLAKTTQPDELGDVVAHVCMLPDHLVIPHLTLLPLVQEIMPY